MKKYTVGLILFIGLMSAMMAVEANKVLKETWNSVGGKLLTQLDWTSTPDSSINIDAFESGVNVAEYYGVRLTAEVTIPTTGTYIFYVAADDQGDLKLSTDNTIENLITICKATTFVNPQDWTSQPEQKSMTYNFIAGQKILLSARMKENVNNDHLSVAWSIDEGPIVVIPISVCLAPDIGPDLPVINPAVVYEKWQGISSDTLDNFDFSQTPLETINYISFEAPNKNLDPFAIARMTALVIVPKTGIYKFYCAGDDQVKLSISIDGIMANIVQVAEVNTWTSSQEWSKFPEQESISFNLIAGQEVAIELLHRDTGGSDNVAAGWSIDGATIEVIQGKYDLWLTTDNLQIDTSTASQVSPAWVEGRFGAASVNTITVTIDGGTAFNADLMGGTRFYANNSSGTLGINLNAAMATALSITNGTNTVTQSITWTPTDIVTAADINIRMGDSLLFTGSGTGTILAIDTNWESSAFSPEHTGIPGENFIQTFDTAGSFIITAQIDGQTVGTMTVTVIDADFDFGDSIACEIGYEREKSITLTSGVADDLTFTSSYDDNLAVKINRWTSAGLIIDILPLAISNEKVAIRINGENGPILAVQEVEEFDLKSQAETYIISIEEYVDGSRLVQTKLEISEKILGLQIDLHVFVSGVTFDDLTLNKTVMTDDFDSQTPALFPYQMIMNSGVSTGSCHTIKIYQNGVQIGN